MSRILLEVCVDDAEGLDAAIKGGADRIELCAALAIGGLTPSIGLMQLSAKAPIPIMVMIRPRAGSFVWTEDELQIMEAEIAATRALGLAGVVIGANLPDGRLDKHALQRLVKAADGLEIALHRSIDLTPDAAQSVHLAVELGMNRILSSGGALKAISGLDRLNVMQNAANGKIIIMPGSGVNISTLPAIAAALPHLTEIHASCSAPIDADEILLNFGFAVPGATRTTVAKVAELQAALKAIADGRQPPS
ncbi:copper homeostasis protein CutC [Brucella sp. NBRC 12950]|uniref:copper homeostasis protein CutC n=1 Tax=Brucella sp. NBRC 12950 TaxID=2994518 RepID=UPI0024A523BC|nr:copper homeostasis protein CutC [Brucella sp. NBRC 12950]GLU28524.1 copper homeostasis protein [Brucella sp. NBRC 12950]